ncbi:UBX domain-containing protein 7 [Venturia canescens]|uniref:UBX domain-containing protein 7 n=1 Tax=Venturia canescens TaxID=32260 RepID=UPI001C9BBE3E|nr:UBX domain-containing protein 7 [Venturia canescens]XP_043278788.1 UBX domain-containing protein 7 [Venturia canescens]
MDRDLIDKFIEVTGESEATAQQYLTLADGNVETAISLMFEGGGPAEAETNNPVIETEPQVREPILPVQEVLVPSEPVCSFPRTSSHVFDRFRDFAVETRRQEEEMTRRVNGARKVSQSRTTRLEDLFRPPYDILFLGSFVEARDHAKDVNRWLLVNVQNSQEFACQILNRDVWPNSQIREIIKDHFVLWQVLSTTSDGKRYIDFYNVTNYPYLAIIDPRTGECMRSYNHITVDSLATGLNDMLSMHASPDNTPPDLASTGDFKERSSLPEKRHARAEPLMDDPCGRNKKSRSSASCSKTSVSSSMSPSSSSSTSNTSNPIIGKRSRIDEFDAKSRASSETAILPHTNSAPKVIDEEEIETEKKACKIVQATNSDEPSLRLCLRLPSGGKEAISMCANDTIEAFIKRMESMGYAPSEHTYLIPFPRTNVGAIPSQTLLSETILYPSNTVFITKV